MLLKILLGIGIGLISVCFLVVVIVGIPLYRFMAMADSLIKIYDRYKKYFSEPDNRQCVILQGKIRIDFVSPKELCEKYEELANEALMYFKKWGFVAMKDIELLERRERLMTICKEIKKIHSNK